MTIKVTYNVTDVYVSESVSATYINVSYEAPSGGGGAVWGDIIGTLSDQLDLQAALDAKVPYSGATANVDLGEYELKAGQLELDQTPTGVAGVAVTRWNDSVGTIETTLKGGSVVLKHGRDMFERIVNKTGIQLTRAAYQAVRVSDAQGQRLAVSLAQANNDNNSADTIGLVVETIDNNQEGYIYTVGEIDGVNTTGTLQGETWADGDVLYLSPTTAGRITNVKPIAPQHLVVIGYVVYAHANNGKIYVKVMNGWELGELHDVDTTGAVNGNVLKYNGTIWTPSGDVGITSLNGLNAVSQTFATGTSGTDFNISSATSTHTFNLPSASATNRGLLTSADWTTFNNKQNALTNPVTGTGVSGQVSYWSGTNTQTGSNNLFWDNTNGILSVGSNVNLSTAFRSQFVTNGNSNFVTSAAFGNTATFRGAFYMLRGRGTQSSPSSILSGDELGQLQFAGYFGSLTDAYVTSASIRAIASANFTSITQIPTHLTFSTSEGGSSVAEKMRLTDTGRLLINSTTDSGQRLQVTGDTLLKGSGNTSSTTALTVQNSDGSGLLGVRNDGVVRFGNLAGGAEISPSNGGDAVSLSSGSGLRYRSAITSTGIDHFFRNYNGARTYTSGTGQLMFFSGGFAPTSGTSTYEIVNIGGTINQTGGANGITRGLYVNPTLTAAADWRSIETSNNSGWSFYGAGTAASYFGGNIAIGSTSGITNTNLRINRNITGLSVAFGVSHAGQVQSDVTTAASYFQSVASTQAATFSTEIKHYAAQQGTFGAGSTVSVQYGFEANSTLIGATNNYGFYGNIASGTGRWNLYMNGSANNYMAGNLGIGSTTLTNVNLRLGKNIEGSANSYGVLLGGEIRSGVTTSADGFTTSVSIQNTAFTLSTLRHFYAIGISSAGSATITNQTGFYAEASLTGATNNFGFRGDIAAATGRWNFYAAGTALNYFNGNTIMGTLAADSGEKLQVNGTMKVTGASTFGGNMTLSLNQNAETSITISNTTAGTTSIARLNLTSDSTSGSARLFKYSSLNTGYKTIAASDFGIFNITAGDISILNDFASGSIKMAAGGSSTAHMTIKSNGRINMSSLPTSATGLSAGDLWNDAGTLKIV